MGWSNLPLAFVDFNTRDERGEVRVLVEDYCGTLAPEPGTLVLLEDADGNKSLGEIVARAGELLRVSPAWETWRSAYRLTGSGVTEGANGVYVGRAETRHAIGHAGATA